MIDKKLTALFIASLFITAACGQSEPEAPAEPAAAAPAPAEPAPAPEPTPEPAADPADMTLAELLASDARPAADRERDAGRKPADVLAFLGVEPGMDVIDLIAAGGWYTEVMSVAVGPEGSVTAQNPGWMRAFRDGGVVAGLDERIGARLSNVTRLDNEWSELKMMEPQFDVAFSALNFHDAYYMESPEAAAEMATAVLNVLRPGGVFGIIDHAGNADGDNAQLHRINRDLVVEIVTGAGFELDAESDLLANTADGHILGVFAEGMRGQTDRFLLRFHKPEE
jgi:predicted methyltransferase